MTSIVLKIGGMSCQGCVKNLTGVLQALAGVVTVEVSLEKAEARVEFDEAKGKREDLASAVIDAGFEAS